MANWKPKTEQLRDRVIIRSRVKTKNAAGYVTTEMTDRLLCWAAVDTWNGGLTVTDEMDTAQDRIRVRIRYRDWIKEGLFVHYNDRDYEISWVDHYDFRNDFLCLECHAAETARA